MSLPLVLAAYPIGQHKIRPPNPMAKSNLLAPVWHLHAIYYVPNTGQANGIGNNKSAVSIRRKFIPCLFVLLCCAESRRQWMGCCSTQNHNNAGTKHKKAKKCRELAGRSSAAYPTPPIICSPFLGQLICITPLPGNANGPWDVCCIPLRITNPIHTLVTL